MITAEEREHLLAHAYVPEHLPAYVTAVSGLTPHLLGDYVAYEGDGVLAFLGYPLSGAFDAAALDEALEAAIRRFDPGIISVDAPVVPAALAGGERSPADAHYRLDLTGFEAPRKVRHMLHRAAREVTVEVGGEFGREHRRLVSAFLSSHSIPEGTEVIFENLPAYSCTPDARLYEARNGKGKLVAFDVADFGARDYAFYLFNLRSRKHAVPGVSDLLLSRLVEDAREAGKPWLGMGLGINPGIVFFKRKWGAVPHVDCMSSRISREGAGTWRDLLG